MGQSVRHLFAVQEYNSYTSVGIAPTLVGSIPTFYVMCRNKIQQWNISYKINVALYTCRNHASYTSVKFLPALYMISYLVWNICFVLLSKFLHVYFSHSIAIKK